MSAVATSQSTGRTRRVFRNWSILWPYALLLVIGAGNCAFDSGPAAAEALFALLALVGALTLILQLRAAIIVSGDEVTVRGWIRTRTESWSNIAGFGYARSNPLNRRAFYIEVLLNDGSRLHTSGLATSSKTSKFALRTVADLEAPRPS
jgi:hypothetical protein